MCYIFFKYILKISYKNTENGYFINKTLEKLEIFRMIKLYFTNLGIIILTI